MDRSCSSIVNFHHFRNETEADVVSKGYLCYLGLKSVSICCENTSVIEEACVLNLKMSGKLCICISLKRWKHGSNAFDILCDCLTSLNINMLPWKYF